MPCFEASDLSIQLEHVIEATDNLIEHLKNKGYEI